MSKADDLRKKMHKSDKPAFAPRPSVTVQPLPQAQKNPVSESSSEVEQSTTAQKQSIAEPTSNKPEELVQFNVKISKEDKRWLGFFKLEHDKDLSSSITEAIQLLKEKYDK